jgi:hypothetical protein
MVDLNLDFAALIGSLTLLLALIGYLFEIGYKNGYYQSAYLSDISNLKRLEHYALAIIISGALVFSFNVLYIHFEDFIHPILILVYDFFIGSSNITFSINNTTYNLSHVSAIFLTLDTYLIIIYYLGCYIGERSNKKEKYIIEIKTTLQNPSSSQQESIMVKSIYADVNDFFYYLDLDNKWGSIRKSDVISMMQIEKSAIETQLQVVSLTQKQNEFTTKQQAFSVTQQDESTNPVKIDIVYN